MGKAVSTPVAPVPGSEIPAGDLDGLCRAVWGRIGREIYMHGSDQPWVWPALNERLFGARRGMDTLGRVMPTREAQQQLLVKLERDLRDLLAADAQRFAYCVRGNATNVAGFSVIHEQAELAQNRAAAHVVARPRVQPIELLSALMQRGITITADTNGNLNVTPANMLGAADRSVLLANKAAIVAALAVPAEVI